MKSQRRHDLQTNVLAEELAGVAEYIKTKGQTILLAVLAVVVVIAVVVFWRASAESRRAEGWRAMLALLHSDAQADPSLLAQLQDVAESYRDPSLRAMAWAQLGSRLLEVSGQVRPASGADAPAVTAEEFAQQAQAAFERVVSEYNAQPVPLAIARLGLARLAARQGNIEAAQAHYEAVVKDPRLEATPYPGQASDELTALRNLEQLPPLATTQPARAEPAAATDQPAAAPEVAAAVDEVVSVATQPAGE